LLILIIEKFRQRFRELFGLGDCRLFRLAQSVRAPVGIMPAMSHFGHANRSQ
jgi:hypothetical protein